MCQMANGDATDEIGDGPCRCPAGTTVRLFPRALMMVTRLLWQQERGSRYGASVLSDRPRL